MLDSVVFFFRRVLRHCVTLFALLLLAAACAPKAVPPPEQKPAPLLHPDQVWQRFRQQTAGQKQDARVIRSFDCNAALHYAGPKAKSRVVLHFWGNLERPLRLELATSLGSTVALWREDDAEFLAYLPDKETAYLHQDGRLGMAAFGINLPFTLQELALLLNGRIADILPQQYTTVRKTKEGNFLFTLGDEKRRFSLLLTPQSVPEGMSTLGPDPWSLEFSGSLEDEGLPELPRKITMQRASGERAILIIKELIQRADSWPEDKLLLDLPPDTRVVILENTLPAR